MRRLLLLTLGVSLAAAAGEQRIELPFWDASGVEYTTDTFERVLKGRFPGIRPVLMLVATRHSNVLEFRLQKSEFEALGHGDVEELQLLFATASTDGPDKSGYWLAPHAAAPLLGDKDFVVLFLRGDGTICSKSAAPLSAASIRKVAGKCRRPPS